MGTRARPEARHHFVRARLSGARHVPLARVPGDRARAPRRQRPIRAAVRTDARLPAAARRHRRHHGGPRRADRRRSGCSSRPARSRGSISSRACSSIPATSSSSSCRPTSARSPRSATCRRELVGVPQEADGIDLDALDASHSTASSREGRRVQFLYVVPNFQNPTGLLIGLDKRQRPARVGGAARRADRRGRSVPRAVLRGLGDRAGRAADQGGRRRSGA